MTTTPTAVTKTPYLLTRVLYEGNIGHIYVFTHQQDTYVLFDEGTKGVLDPQHDKAALNTWDCNQAASESARSTQRMETLAAAFQPMVDEFRRTLPDELVHVNADLTAFGTTESNVSQPMSNPNFMPPASRILTRGTTKVVDVDADQSADFLAFTTRQGVRVELSAYLVFSHHPMAGVCEDWVAKMVKGDHILTNPDWPINASSVFPYLQPFDGLFVKKETP